MEKASWSKWPNLTTMIPKQRTLVDRWPEAWSNGLARAQYVCSDNRIARPATRSSLTWHRCSCWFKQNHDSWWLLMYHVCMRWSHCLTREQLLSSTCVVASDELERLLELVEQAASCREIVCKYDNDYEFMINDLATYPTSLWIGIFPVPNRLAKLETINHHTSSLSITKRAYGYSTAPSCVVIMVLFLYIRLVGTSYQKGTMWS